MSAAESRDPLAWLEQLFLAHPSRVFLKTLAGQVIRYDELDIESRRMAAALTSLGVKSGDRVTVQVEKSPQVIFLYIACLRLGAIFMPLNTAYTDPELTYFISDAEPRVVLVVPEREQTISSLCDSLSFTKGQRPTVLSMDTATAGSFADRVAQHLIDPRSLSCFAPLASDDVAALVYTSGTTGRSKGAMLTRANLAANSRNLVKAWAFTTNDVLLHALPVFHVHGLFIGVDTVLASGCTLLFLPKFEVEAVLHALPQSSVMMGVPTFYTRLLGDSRLNRKIVTGLRLCISGSAPLLPQTHRDFEARTGHCILERYGMTETLINSSNPYEGLRRPGSVGRPLPDVEIRIVDPENDCTLVAQKAIGSIEVKGANVFAGYWRAIEKTTASFRPDGFFVTGDLGYLDADGYLYIVGRDKDLIITGGFNVYPIEIEEAINTLPGVVESAVIGLPHSDFGEGVVAIVVALGVAQGGSSLTEQAILGALGSRIANFKLPKRVLFADDLPRNAMGKVQKRQLRSLHACVFTRPRS